MTEESIDDEVRIEVRYNPGILVELQGWSYRLINNHTGEMVGTSLLTFYPSRSDAYERGVGQRGLLAVRAAVTKLLESVKDLAASTDRSDVNRWEHVMALTGAMLEGLDQRPTDEPTELPTPTPVTAGFDPAGYEHGEQVA